MIASFAGLAIFNGIGASLELLEPFVEALQDVEIIAFDVPGTGASPTTLFPHRYHQLAGGFSLRHLPSRCRHPPEHVLAMRVAA